ncbi:MAG: XRE family transcriptional regulator [Acidobacteriaceae bacterium]
MPSTSLVEQEIDAVEADKVEQYIDDKFIGERIRRLRLKRSMGLVELGTRTGLSASFLSQLETGRVIPTIRNLAKLALVFQKDLSYFFRQEKAVTFRTLHQSDRVRLTRNSKDGSRFVAESLSALIPDRRMVPCLAEFFPGDQPCDFTPKIFPGMEFIYILEGSLCLVSSNGHEQLDCGDVAWIDARTKRQYVCSGEQHSKAMIITFPQE